MRNAFLTGAFVCALSVSSFAPRAALAQPGLPFRTAGVPSITGTIGNTSLYGEKTIHLDTSGLLTVTDGRGTHNVQLTNAQATNLIEQVKNADMSHVPSTIPDPMMNMGATAFDLTIKDASGKTYNVSGADIDTANQFGNHYPGLETFLTSLDTLVVNTSDGPNVGPVIPPSPVKDDFDGVKIELENPMTRWNTNLEIQPDGTYTYYKSGPDVLAPISGKLTDAQLSALKKAYAGSDFSSLPDAMPGMVPDSTTFSLTAGGKTVTGWTNGEINAPHSAAWTALLPLLDNLERTTSRIAPEPPVARPTDSDSKKSDHGFFGSIGDFFSGVGDTIGSWFSSGSKTAPARSDDTTNDPMQRSKGLIGVLGSDVQGSADADVDGATDK